MKKKNRKTGSKGVKAKPYSGASPHSRAQASDLFTPKGFEDNGNQLRRATAAAALAETDLYFAFGSNMNRPQMARRCPSAVLVGAAELPDWRLASRGVADVERAKGATVHGAIWRLTSECIEALDRYEGYPTFYGREVVRVRVPTLGTVYAWVYAMAPCHQSHVSPFSLSYALACAEGARQCGTVVDPLFIRDIVQGPRDAGRRPWSKEINVVEVPISEDDREDQPTGDPLPAFAVKAVEKWCVAKRISLTKVANLVAFARYDSEKRQIRISGGGAYVTIEDVGPKRRPKDVPPIPSADELDAIETSATAQLVSDDELVTEVEEGGGDLNYADARFLQECRLRLTMDGALLTESQRARLERMAP